MGSERGAGSAMIRVCGDVEVRGSLKSSNNGRCLADRMGELGEIEGEDKESVEDESDGGE